MSRRDDDFTGEFAMAGRRARERVVDADMPRGVRAQTGMGDVEEEFADVTRGLDDMHRRVLDPQEGDPMTSFSTRGYYDDVQQDAAESAAAAVDVDIDAGVGVGGDRGMELGDVADIDPEIRDIATDDFERGEL